MKISVWNLQQNNQRQVLCNVYVETGDLFHVAKISRLPTRQLTCNLWNFLSKALFFPVCYLFQHLLKLLFPTVPTMSHNDEIFNNFFARYIVAPCSKYSYNHPVWQVCLRDGDLLKAMWWACLAKCTLEPGSPTPTP